MPDSAPDRVTTWQSLRAVARSWRLLSVALMSFVSALPLGLVWIAIPTWMKQAGHDIRLVGLLSLAQAPWSFKFLWSPLMDRYVLPFLGRKRGWIFLSQCVLLALSLAFVRAAAHPENALVIGVLCFAMAFAGATQDIAIDAYAVEVLLREEYGLAVGARALFGRAGMFVSGGVAITFGATASWERAHLFLALLYAPFLLVTWFAPEPDVPPEPPKTLKEAVWGPFVGFLSQHRALEILAFVVLYKLSDNLAQALIGPFLVQTGFGPWDVGVGRVFVGNAALLGGTLLGGLLSSQMGLGRALWIFGIIQTVAHLGYAAVAEVGPVRSALYGAQVLEMGTSGLANGAFSVLLLRLTEKRFSATQYALLSSLFAIPRVLSGPVAGALADALHWRNFFIGTVFAGIPGLLLLDRFVPWGVREPEFRVAEPTRKEALTRSGLALRAVLAGVVAWALSAVCLGLLAGLKSPAREGGLPAELVPLLLPRGAAEWTRVGGLLLVATTVGLGAAAALAARRGIRPRDGA